MPLIHLKFKLLNIGRARVRQPPFIERRAALAAPG
jgi:hypothetical protein